MSRSSHRATNQDPGNRRAISSHDLSPSPTATRPWAGFPQTALTTGDFHGLVVFATPTDGSGFRVSLKYVGPVADQTLALGPTLGAPTLSQVAAGAYPRFRFQGNLAAEYAKGATIDVLGVEGAGNIYSISATGAWLAASGNPLTYDFTMPNVGSLGGFPVASRLAAGTNDVSARGFGFIGTGTLDLPPAIGGVFKSAVRNAALNVP